MGWFSALVGGVVGFFVGGPVGAVIGAGIGATKVGEKVVNTVVEFVTQPFMPSIPSVDTGAGSEAERQQGVLVQTQGSTVNVPVVYGYRKVGGAVVFAETGSTDNKYLYVAYVFSEGLVEGLREVFIDDWMLPTDQVGSLNAGQLVTVNSDRYKDRVQLQWFPGVYHINPRNSTVGSTVKSSIFADSPNFTSSMNFNGLAVLFARYEWKKIVTQADSDNNPFSGSIPQVQVSMLGKRVASLLVDDTQNIPYDSNAVRYSTNPAECLLDYLRNPRYGKGLINDDIDWTTWKQAARKCNTTVSYVASGIQGPILTMNAVIDTSSTLMSNTKTMLQNFRGYMPYVQGKYKLKIEDAGNTTDILSGAALIVQTLTKDDIVSDITFNGIERSAKYNVVSVTYVDPDQKWSNQQIVYPETEAERQTYIALDGGRENKYETTLGCITNYAIAKDMARLIFNKQRRQESCVFTATSKALELEPGDCIRIQSNILNFGTDPWRIVSYKVNNDMTVDLGCVRNPDDIYPYVRVGEEDIVLPTYVPKGSIIYYPSSSNLPPVGLVPPQFAVFPPAPVILPTNPVPTDPNGSTGGGVGGGSGGSSTTVTVTPNPVVTTNNTSTPPPPPPPFDAVLSFKKVIYTKSDENSGVFTIVFTQPSAAMYDYSTFWWRLNPYSNWVSSTLNDKPGAGGEISVNVGPLPKLGRTYEYYVRAYASDGRASSNVLNGNFLAVESQTTAGVFLGAGSGSSKSATDGWAPPASQVPTSPWWNDDIEELSIRPKLTSGHPGSPRRMTLSLTQMIYTSTTPANPLLSDSRAGVYVYYKYKDDVYWQREELAFPAGYYPGKSVSWDLAGDFGSPAYPLAGVDALYSPTIYQKYDFIVRLKYADGKTAEKQLVGYQAPVEVNGTGLWDFISVGTASTAAIGTKSLAIPTGFTIPLVSQQDPTLTYNTGQDLMPNFFRITANPSTSSIQFQFNPPANSKFRGYRIRYRPVTPGADPDFITKDIGTTTTGSVIIYDLNSDYSHSTKYEWMITALYRDNTGNTADANNCWYARAAIPFGVPSGTDLLNSYFNFETKDTKTTLGDITAAFPAVATIVPQKWIKKQLVKYSAGDLNFVSANSVGDYGDVRKDSTGQITLNTWYQLQFQAPNQTFTSLIIYRRVFSASGAARTVVGSAAKYYGLGAWERVSVLRTNLTHLGSGVYTVNVRGPIHPDLFEPYYQITAGKTLFRNSYGNAPSRYPYPGAVPYIEGVFPYYGAGNDLSSGNYKAEFLFVLDDGGEGTKGARVTEFNTDTSGAGFKTEVDGIQSANIPRDDYRTLADYNSYTAGFYRNLNEALTGIATGALSANETWARNFPRYNATYTGFLSTFYLNGPSGVTVY